MVGIYRDEENLTRKQGQQDKPKTKSVEDPLPAAKSELKSTSDSGESRVDHSTDNNKDQQGDSSGNERSDQSAEHARSMISSIKEHAVQNNHRYAESVVLADRRQSSHEWIVDQLIPISRNNTNKSGMRSWNVRNEETNPDRLVLRMGDLIKGPHSWAVVVESPNLSLGEKKDIGNVALERNGVRITLYDEDISKTPDGNKFIRIQFPGSSTSQKIPVGLPLPPDIKTRLKGLGFFGITSLNNDVVMPPEFILEHLLFSDELRLAADKIIPGERGPSRLDKIAEKVDKNFWNILALFTIPLKARNAVDKYMSEYSTQMEKLQKEFEDFIKGWKLEKIREANIHKLKIRRNDNKSEVDVIEDTDNDSRSSILIKTTFGGRDAKVLIPSSDQNKVVLEFVDSESHGERIEFNPDDEEEVEKIAIKLKVKKEKLTKRQMVSDVMLTGRLFSDEVKNIEDQELDSREVLEKMVLG